MAKHININNLADRMLTVAFADRLLSPLSGPEVSGPLGT